MTDPQRPPDWDEPISIPEVETRLDRILVPFDGSHAGERALGYAANLARATEGEIVVVVAYDPPITVRRRGALTLESLRIGMEEEAHSLASESVELLRAMGLGARGIVVRGEVVEAILDTAETEEAAIIILGRHGLSHEMRSVGGRRELGHGSVADKVARHAEIPVLVVS
jgi:nucleotide-binding universal stress UspA family protein